MIRISSFISNRDKRRIMNDQEPPPVTGNEGAAKPTHRSLPSSPDGKVSSGNLDGIGQDWLLAFIHAEYRRQLRDTGFVSRYLETSAVDSFGLTRQWACPFHSRRCHILFSIWDGARCRLSGPSSLSPKLSFSMCKERGIHADPFPETNDDFQRSLVLRPAGFTFWGDRLHPFPASLPLSGCNPGTQNPFRLLFVVEYWKQGPDSNRRSSGYEPNEVPLLHPAINFQKAGPHSGVSLYSRPGRGVSNR